MARSFPRDLVNRAIRSEPYSPDQWLKLLLRVVIVAALLVNLGVMWQLVAGSYRTTFSQTTFSTLSESLLTGTLDDDYHRFVAELEKATATKATLLFLNPG